MVFLRNKLKKNEYGGLGDLFLKSCSIGCINVGFLSKLILIWWSRQNRNSIADRINNESVGACAMGVRVFSFFEN